MAERAGVTTKVSLSVRNEDLRILKDRAKRLHGGNVSAVFAELIATIKRQEAWERALAWYGKPIGMTDDERDEIDRELSGKTSRPTRRKRAG
jgi:hypothetical protein